MTKSATRIQDKDTQKRVSVVQSIDDPTKYGIVILNPDGTPISGGGGGGGNVKAFTLSSTSDLTTAQNAYNWYKAGKVPVVRYNSGDYLVEFADSSKVILCSTGYHKETETSYNGRTQNNLIFNLSSDTVTSIVTSYGGTFTMYYLSPAVNYETPYIPQYDGSPATKKYVDDTASGKISDTAYGSGWDADTTHAPSKNAVYDELNSMNTDISNNTTAIGTNTGAIATINSKIPSAATSSNQLADKDYVNDGINSVTAYYITKNAQGDQWSTRAELFAATTFYSGGVVRVPTKNDYTIVLSDENHDNATTRYIYNSGWEYQYTVNETALTQAQLDALNSGITAGKVSTYDGYASGKQDTLTLPATPTQGNLVTWGADNETFVDGGAIPTGVPSGGNNGDVLTNVSGIPTWSAPSGGDVMVSSQSGNILTSGMKIWAGTEADYGNLGTYDSNTVYLTI